MSHTSRVVEPSVAPLISTSVGDTTLALAMAGSPMVTRTIATGFTSSAEAPFDTEMICWGWETTRCASRAEGAASARTSKA